MGTEISYADQRRIEREKKDRQKKERQERAGLIAKQMAKDNPEWKYIQDQEHSDFHYVAHKDGARVSVSCVYPYRKITALYHNQRQDFSGGPQIEAGVDGDRDVMEAAKSLAKRVLPGALEKYARHLENKAIADKHTNDYKSLLERYIRICEAQIDDYSMRQYIDNHWAIIPFLDRKGDGARGEISVSTGAYNKITIDYLTHEQAQKLIFAIRETLNK